MSNKKSENKKSTSIIKESFQASWLLHKKLWIFGIVVACIAAVIGIGYGILNTTPVKHQLIYSMADKEFIGNKQNGELITFYLEKNKDFKGEIDEINNETILQMFNIYYLDGNNEKVYIENGEYIYETEEGETKIIRPTIGFILGAYGKYTKLQKAGSIIGWVSLAVVILGSIIAWYIWDIRQNKKKQKAKYDNANKNRKARNKKKK